MKEGSSAVLPSKSRPLLASPGKGGFLAIRRAAGESHAGFHAAATSVEAADPGPFGHLLLESSSGARGPTPGGQAPRCGFY